MTITFRSVKGSALTHSELDGNFTDLDDRTDVVEGVGASANEIYLADGADSGSWVAQKSHIGGYISFDSSTPAYTLATGGTSDVVIDPTFTGTHAHNMTASTTPNARMTYTGAEDLHAFVGFNASMKQSSGGTIDVEIVVYVNGAALEGSRVVRSATNGAWGSVSMHFDMVLEQDDYVEFFLKTPGGAATILFAQAYMSIQGTAEV